MRSNRESRMKPRSVGVSRWLIDGETPASKRTCGGAATAGGKRSNQTNNNALKIRLLRRRVPAGNGARAHRVDRGEESLYA
jgi:hypothetical protein